MPPMPSPADRADLQDRVVRLLQSGDTAAAASLARDALAAGIETALFLNLRAHLNEQEGRVSEALADLERAHELEPGDVHVLNALALALARSGRFPEAASALDDAIAREPGFGPFHFNRGWVAEELGELDSARESYARAAGLSPGDPNPPARLAAAAIRLGEADAARQWAERALAIDPHHPGGCLALAGADFRQGQVASARERLDALLRDPRLPPFERALALTLSGDISDSLGMTPDAFADYSAANETVRAMHASRFAHPVGHTLPQYLRRLHDHFAHAPAWSEPPAPARRSNGARGHVFLIGFPRSGTTLLEEALARHPLVVTTQERDGLADGVRDLMSVPGGLQRLVVLSEDDAEAYRARYWQRLGAHGIVPEGRIVVDKQPYNTVNLPLIARLFPEARIVFSLRDPRDVVLSCFRRQFRMNPANWELLTLKGAAGLYNDVMRLAELYRMWLPLVLREQRFEELVRDFRGGLETLCRFLDLPFDQSLLEFAGRAGRRAIVTPSAGQIASGLNRDGIGVWRRYAAQMAPVLPMLEFWVKRFGYKDN
jgi:Tfp pilus assembly protein PilF